MTPSKVVLNVWMLPLRARYFTSTRSPRLPYRMISLRLVRRSRTGHIGPEAVVLRHRLEDLAVPALGGGHAPPRQRSAPSSIESVVVRQDEVGSISSREPRPVQSGQAPWGELKLKLRGAELLEGAAVLRAGVLLAEEPVGLLRRCVRQVRRSGAPSDEPQRRLDRVGHAASRPAAGCLSSSALADDQAVDDDLDACACTSCRARSPRRGRGARRRPGRGRSRPAWRRLEELLVLALAVLDQRRQQHDPRPLGQLETWSTICSTVWRSISRPQIGQCRRPTRANSRRR